MGPVLSQVYDDDLDNLVGIKEIHLAKQRVYKKKRLERAKMRQRQLLQVVVTSLMRLHIPR